MELTPTSYVHPPRRTGKTLMPVPRNARREVMEDSSSGYGAYPTG